MLTSVQNLASGATPSKLDILRRQSQQFESLFLYKLLESMRRTVPQSGLFPASQGEEIFRQLLDQKFAEAAAERGQGMGIGRAVYQKLAQHFKTAPTALSKEGRRMLWTA